MTGLSGLLFTSSTGAIFMFTPTALSSLAMVAAAA
jgi:hypothetical protein